MSNKFELEYNHFLRGDDETGWPFGAGPPEFWKYQDRLLVPGGRALELGIGTGRTAMFFALQGMEIEGVDLDPECVKLLNDFARKEKLPIRAHLADINQVEFLPDYFDTVVSAQMLVHWPSREAAMDILSRSYDSLKTGGHFWLRAGGNDCQEFEDLKYQAENQSEWGYEEVEPGVFMHDCECTPEEFVPTIFFHPSELIGFFTQRGASIIHTQTIPIDGEMNIMYGEDWHSASWGKNGMISVLAQKK